MNPTDDTLNSGDTLPRHSQPTGGGTAGQGPAGEFAFQETIRMPGAGTIVFQRYRLERMVGRGGMGVVWQAVDTKLDRTVALKFLPDIVGADPAALKELMDETRRGLELAHPNIVRIHDLVTDEATAAISMEYVEGKNLSERRLLRPHRVFSVEDTAPWVGQLCGAMDYAHLQKRIVHRDVKPANLMLSAEGELKITDFGIARSVSDAVSRLSRTMQQGASGTLPYMSPQQVMGERPHPTDDVYSIGATLYELLTGKPPFYSGDISFQITSKTVPPISQRREELAVGASDVIPAEWEEAIASCLDKDPTKRPQTAGELARRLGLMPHGGTGHVVPVRTSTATQKPAETPAPPPPAPATPLTPAKKKLPVLAIVLGGVAALVMLATAATAALYWYSHRQGEWLVQTQPTGAQVTMDGLTFPTPATVSLHVGTHRASITLEGYEPHELEFNVEPGARTDLGVVQLERSAGQLLLSSDPDGVDYEVIPADAGNAEKAAGKTPDTIRLPVGRYSVTMNHGGARKSAEVDVARNTTSRQSFAFDHAPVPPAQTPMVTANTEPPAKPAPTPPPSAAGVEPKPLATDPIPHPASPSAPQQSQERPPSPAMARAPDSGSSRVSFLTGGQGLSPSPAPETDPSTIPAPPPDTAPTLPSDPTEPGAAPPVVIAPQPTVEPPAAGYWTLDEILSNSEYATYSEPGRRYLVYKAQQAMNESADGVPGKGTYKAIQKFQTESTLQPTGQLDSATLAALGLSGQPDKADWSRSRGSSGNRTPESEKTAARKFIERKVLGGRDLKDIFRR